ncbi:DpnD/PcfM family protein [Petroclostridium sp. X23]|uniref:DpnD/PcfM family protein n=1 Tax=Petroclostridium sp. X23 TaxID=3045146 RepID=UPI0024AD56EC|nr:DpnD/PcfM family protein [Petroclostridium sp. X23]WHH59754.1 DpnD/PcfM family protein [Petroclostridium sp. X23]
MRNQRLFFCPKSRKENRPMRTNQIGIKETLCMTIEIEADSEQQAEAMVRETYSNSDYILDVEHFTGVDFYRKGKEMVARSKSQKYRGQDS